MRVQDLPSYGRSFAEIGEIIPPETLRSLRRRSMKGLRKRLGLFRMVRFVRGMVREQSRLQRHDFASVRANGLSDERFLQASIQNAAVYAALRRVVGEARALAILMDLAESSGGSMMSGIFPSAEVLEASGDPLASFAQFMKAGNKANHAAGIHRVEEIEHTDSVYRFNVTYCAFHAIPADVGLGAACLSSCHADDVFFPRYCDRFGVRFSRSGTLARGDAVCDFRFERVEPESRRGGHG